MKVTRMPGTMTVRTVFGEAEELDRREAARLWPTTLATGRKATTEIMGARLSRLSFGPLETIVYEPDSPVRRRWAPRTLSSWLHEGSGKPARAA
jgi:hypothetical protein